MSIVFLRKQNHEEWQESTDTRLGTVLTVLHYCTYSELYVYTYLYLIPIPSLYIIFRLREIIIISIPIKLLTLDGVIVVK